MSQAITRKNLTRASLRRREDPHTVLRRMAIEAERAERIADLKERRPDLTWRQIGDAVGVAERSAIAWQRTGGIDYNNAKKLAKVFGVTVEWLWSGVGAQPVVEPEAEGQLDRIERKLDEVLKKLELAHLDELAEAFERLPNATTATQAPPKRNTAHG